MLKKETSWFKILNHDDDDEEKTDRKAEANMVYSYIIFPFFFLIVTSFDYNASISQLVSLRPILATAGSR